MAELKFWLTFNSFIFSWLCVLICVHTFSWSGRLICRFLYCLITRIPPLYMYKFWKKSTDFPTFSRPSTLSFVKSCNKIIPENNMNTKLPFLSMCSQSILVLVMWTSSGQGFAVYLFLTPHIFLVLDPYRVGLSLSLSFTVDHR